MGKQMELMRINRSPFDKDVYHEKYVRDAPMEKVSFRIPKTAYNDLMTYFKGNGMDKSEGFNQILTDKLQLINSSKRTCFNNVELIMLLPKTKNLEELDDKSQIIACYNTKSDFHESYEYNDGFGKSFNIQYEMEEFCEDFFSLEPLQNMKESNVFGVNFGEMMDWDSFSAKLGELYEDLDMEDCYFVRFPLNNYLDVNRQGQFQHSRYMGKHQGIYIFDVFGYRRFYCLFNWSYHESGVIAYNFRFLPMGEFMRILEDSPHKNLNECYENLKNSKKDKEEIEELINKTERHLDFLKRLHDKI